MKVDVMGNFIRASENRDRNVELFYSYCVNGEEREIQVLIDLGQDINIYFKKVSDPLSLGIAFKNYVLCNRIANLNMMIRIL
jgi:hypothetical protein